MEYTISDSCRLAYIAGFFDGEGCIYPDLRDRKISLTITNTKPQVLRSIQLSLGGQVRHNIPSRPEEKTVYVWGCFNQKDQLRILKKLLPYLILKKENALIAIELLEGIPRGIRGGYNIGLRDSEYIRRQPLLDRLKVLNRKGVRRQ